MHVTLRALVSSLRDFPVFDAVEHVGLSRGMQGLVARLAKAVNRAMRRRGPVFADHYHAHELRTPTEVRNALVYVLNNWKKHLPGANRGVDGCSSGKWFQGWTDFRPDTGPPLAAAGSWLLAAGWRKRGLIQTREKPRVEFLFS
jgi:hypothetical protein